MKDSYYDKLCPLDYLSRPFYKGRIVSIPILQLRGLGYKN